MLNRISLRRFQVNGIWPAGNRERRTNLGAELAGRHSSWLVTARCELQPGILIAGALESETAIRAARRRGFIHLGRRDDDFFPRRLGLGVIAALSRPGDTVEHRRIVEVGE